jgi:hypothetical protein
MVPHQIYQALTDQRTHELEAAARRHERIATAQSAATDPSEASSRFKTAVAHVVALVHGRRGAHAKATATTGSGAGTMGCLA